MEISHVKNGFVKRASQFGLSALEATVLFKEAEGFGGDMMKHLQGAGDWMQEKGQQGMDQFQNFKTEHPEAYRNSLGGLAGAGVGALGGAAVGGGKGALAGAAGGAALGAGGTSLYNNPEILKQLLGQQGPQQQPQQAPQQGGQQGWTPPHQRGGMIPQGY